MLVVEFSATPKGLFPACTVAIETWAIADVNSTATPMSSRKNRNIDERCMGLPSREILSKLLLCQTAVVARLTAVFRGLRVDVRSDHMLRICWTDPNLSRPDSGG